MAVHRAAGARAGAGIHARAGVRGKIRWGEERVGAKSVVFVSKR